ncbi:MAG: MBL fold metallo-hydrolase [Hyphomicrobiales bacterium]
MHANRVILSAIISLVFGISNSLAAPKPDLAQSKRQPVSTCLAIAENLQETPLRQKVEYANFDERLRPGPTLVAAATEIDTDPIRALTPFEVRIGFFDHSTYIIESHAGVTAATDYFGFAQYKSENLIPTIVTMNKAHSTHFTLNPDARIEHVLPGWGADAPAKHLIQVEDMLVRNVPTDIVRGGFREADANSIFIFEVAGLCIGHLGHLHHALTDTHYANIGRLDVVMVPIDGAMTLSLVGMAEIVKRMRASVILPMHARGFATPDTLISMLGDNFDSLRLSGNSIILTINSLPRKPTVIVPSRL